ncbi:YopX family protein [Enterococcus dispar]|uniref:YopX family protein n=1 Tax=Enterococcus dispar TaxID=44009 RepID=UPI0021D3FFF8|nr:YopX family protein [Enterococcus dispar]MCU7356268.1 YopX family protein [Enterococcus dispar]
MIPKFRAWYTPFKGEKYGQKMKYGSAGSLITHAEMSPDKYILMQYTGFKDKNGVEIFEGDIVNHYWSNEVGESFCHKAVIKNPFDYKVNEAMHLIYADELEILGNIWENPELLEGE